MKIRFETNVPKYLRGSFLYRREQMNHIKRLMRDVPPRRHHTVKQVVEILDEVGIYISQSTMRSYIRDGLCRAHKKKKHGRWWIMTLHIIRMADTMDAISELYERIKETRKTAIRYVDVDRRPLPPRDHLGRFTKREKTTPYYDHSHMMPRLQ
jgi:hypothetical protein